MKKFLTILQWCLAGAFACCLIGTGFHWTSLLVLVAVVLMLPLTAVQKVLAKIKIKRWVAVVAAVVLLFAAIGMQPQSSAPNETEKGSTFATATTLITTTTTLTSSSSSVVTTATVKPTTVANTSTTTHPTTTTATTVDTTTTSTTTTVTTANPTSTSTMTTTTTKPTIITTTTVTQQQTTYILNTNTKKIHRSSCRYVKDIKAENYQEYHGHTDTLTAQGYQFCKVCF